MNEVAISLTNVSKYYKLYKSPKDRLKEALSFSGKKYHKEFYATKNLNLEIKKGEILGVVGKNGSGKSTLLKLITSVLAPSQGKIKVNGEISALLELGSGFNPQYTGIENIYFYGAILGFSKEEMDEKIDDIVAFADIGEFIDQPIKTYSSGMKARLGFAVAINIEPEILILDEVLSVGDVLFKRKAYAKMQEFFESGITIIYVSHNTNEINRLCTRAVFLLDGEIIMDSDPKTVTKYYEKYLFANKENQKNMKKEIIALSSEHNYIKNPEPTTKRENESSHDLEPDANQVKHETIKPSSIKNTQKSFLIHDFESKNRVEYDNSFLEIYDICIKTIDNEIVNALVMYERYRYCYTLRFKKEFFNVGFGMQIHTEKGVVITGCGSKQGEYEQSIDHVQAGDIFEIEWEFDCLMYQGVYYTNVGVMNVLNDKKEFINRITDASVFKVLPSQNCCGGLVSLRQSLPSISYIKPL